MAFLSGVGMLTVFVVEPSNVQSQFIDSHLKSLGVLSTVAFKDGASALQAMAENRPDVVISSMHLPDMTGGDLVGRMRTEEATRNVAFILVSSESNPHYLEPVRQSGSSAMLGKPFTAEQMHKALSTALDYLNPVATKLEVEGDDRSRIDQSAAGG